MSKLSSANQAESKPSLPRKRAYVKQSDVPALSLDEALRVPVVLFDQYAGKPTLPLFVAKALPVDPGGSQFRLYTGAAIAYGLIDGGAQASEISVTDLAKRILRPTAEGTSIIAKREAVLKPRIFNEFLVQFDGNPVPRRDIAQNILEEKSLARERASEAFDRIMENAHSVGFVHDINGKLHISLRNPDDVSHHVLPKETSDNLNTDLLSIEQNLLM